MNSKIVYTPGPTEVKENVRLARAIATTNPDLDLDFCEFYKKTCDKIGNIINTKNDVYILSGEGILGLEAACASLTEKGDRVLVIDNGIFGKGFDEFVKMYGGEVVYFSKDYTKDIDADELEEFLKNDSDFKYATLVHCDTPTGVLNDLSKLCPVLKKYGIISVVDSVAAMVGEELKVDEWKIDIVIGGSQKAISASSGLTIVSVSDNAKEVMKNRKHPVIGFYCNLTIWENYYRDKWFPYTMPISDIIGLSIAIDNILEEGISNVLLRHEKVAKATKEAFKEYGLKLYLEKGYSNTVTVIEIPEEIGAKNLTNKLLKKYNLILATSLGDYSDKVIRIGHMGENAKLEKIIPVLYFIDEALGELGYERNKSLVNLFNKYYR